MYTSWDDGLHWTRLRNGLPPAPVHWLALQPHFNDLVVATYGRGIWIMDDISSLREYDDAQKAEAYLFKTSPTYRFHRDSAVRASESGAGLAGQNPPYGADINFWLKTPHDKVSISIVGSDDKTIRTLSVEESGAEPRLVGSPLRTVRNGPPSHAASRCAVGEERTRGVAAGRRDSI